MADDQPLLFRGRARERRELDRLLDGVRRGEGAVLVIRGEAGIGKTSLMHYGARQAAGCRIVSITGVQSELELPFAALHQLCQPMLDGISVLPEPQSEALRVAFGLMTGPIPGRFVVGMAVLSLLCEAASHRPLVCLVDDAQWLDEPTAHVLAFVARRLLAEPVVLLFSVRETVDDGFLPGLPAMTVQGLTDEDARALLTAAVPGHLDERVRDRLVAETRGNPLALLELPKGMSPGELAGGFAVPSPASLRGQLEDGYVRRVRALPEATQRLMLLAAAEPTGDATLLWRAAASLEVGRDAAALADQEQLLEIGSQVRFRHPLVRSAAYAAASAEERGSAHLALADATDPGTDPERRVWHLAAAATDPDEGIATELERTAGAAQSRAGLAAAAAFLERSFALTAEPTRKAVRALAAATANLHAGDFDRARSLLAEAGAATLDDLQLAQVEQLMGQVEAAARPGGEAPVRLLQAARVLVSLDVRLARETYLQAWWAAFLAGRLAAPGGDLMSVCVAALAAPRPASPRPCDLLLDGLATTVTAGPAAAAADLRSAIELFVSGRVSDDDWLQWGRSAAAAAWVLWDFDSWLELSAGELARARASGALSSLVLALNLHANNVTLIGDLDTAAALMAEQSVVKEITGIQMASYGARLLTAYRGRPSSAIDDEPAGDREGYGMEAASLEAAVLNNARGRYAEALEAARDVISTRSFFARWAVPELIEAAVRTAQPDVAGDGFRRLSELKVDGSDWADGIVARCRALISSGADAEKWYSLSVEHLGRTRLRLELARSELLYGEWLRREPRRADARQHLRRAYDLFTAAGAEVFAERTRSELLATGEKVRKRKVGADHLLTPHEEHIARLARDGRTNPQIGAELFISPRTVEWHLRKIFAKLGITSRNGLRDVLPPPTR